MTKQEQEQIEEMAKEIFNSGIAIRVSDLAYGLIDNDDPFHRLAKYLYNANYLKTFTRDLTNDTQKAFKAGYSKGVDYGIEFGKVLLYKTRKETVKEVTEKLKNYFEDKLVDEFGNITTDIDEIKGCIDELLKEYEK